LCTNRLPSHHDVLAQIITVQHHGIMATTDRSGTVSLLSLCAFLMGYRDSILMVTKERTRLSFGGCGVSGIETEFFVRYSTRNSTVLEYTNSYTTSSTAGRGTDDRQILRRHNNNVASSCRETNVGVDQHHHQSPPHKRTSSQVDCCSFVSRSPSLSLSRFGCHYSLGFL